MQVVPSESESEARGIQLWRKGIPAIVRSYPAARAGRVPTVPMHIQAAFVADSQRAPQLSHCEHADGRRDPRGDARPRHLRLSRPWRFAPWLRSTGAMPADFPSPGATETDAGATAIGLWCARRRRCPGALFAGRSERARPPRRSAHRRLKRSRARRLHLPCPGRWTPGVDSPHTASALPESFLVLDTREGTDWNHPLLAAA